MKINSMYPVICTDLVQETAEWYKTHFGFTETFATDWYVSLANGDQELAVLDRTHETIPETFRNVPAAGFLVSFEVEDVDAEWERIVVQGEVKPELELRSEDFGQRHFIVADPSGVLVDVITNIEPAEGYAQAYTD